MFKRFSLQNLRLQNLIFYAIAAYIVVMIIFQQGSVDTQRQRYEEAQRELEAAQQRQTELLEQQEYVKTDEYKEELAREEGYVADDEIVFIYELEQK